MIVQLNRNAYTALTLIIVGGLAYLELYPFVFRVPPDDSGAVRKLFESWVEPPSRGDFIANILAYMPLGFCATRAFNFPRSLLGRLPLIILVGSGLSLGFELAQYFVDGRVTSIADVCANTLGVVFGAASAAIWAKNTNLVLRVGIFAKPVPLILLGAWTAYRTYPYVPTTDLHKFWEAIKPLVLTPTPPPYDLWRHTTIWLVLFALVEAVLGRRRSIGSALLLVGFLTGARISIIGQALSIAELAGAGTALFLWALALLIAVRLRASVLALMLGAYIIVERLQPFLFQGSPKAFGWLPFRSFMTGSLEIDLMAFLEKSFLYGSLLFLLTETGFRLRTVSIVLALLLFATSWAETYLPGRSAEITDAMMVMLIGLGFSLLSGSRDIGISCEPSKSQPIQTRVAERNPY